MLYLESTACLSPSGTASTDSLLPCKGKVCEKLRDKHTAMLPPHLSPAPSLRDGGVGSGLAGPEVFADSRDILGGLNDIIQLWSNNQSRKYAVTLKSHHPSPHMLRANRYRNGRYHCSSRQIGTKGAESCRDKVVARRLSQESPV